MKTTLRSHLTLGAILLVVVLAVVLLLRTGCAKDSGPEIEGPIQIKPDSVMIRERPKPPASFVQKIVRHRVPSQITVSQGTPDTVRAMMYANAAHEADSLRRLVDSLRRGDSTDRARAARVAKPRPLLPPVSGSYKKDRFTLWLTRSDGSLMRATAKLRPNFEFYAGQDRATEFTPDFSEDRWWVRSVRKVGKCAPRAGAIGGIAGGLGAVSGSDKPLRDGVIGGVSALVGCLIG